MTGIRGSRLPAVVGLTTVAGLIGYVGTHAIGPGVSRTLPWVIGRGLGVAAYLTLTSLVVLGLWLRHPWRLRVRGPSPDLYLRAHAVLAASTLALVIGHVAALMADPWAGVGIRGAVQPGGSTYRPVAVALGTIGVYGAALIALTTVLAGRIGRIWRPVHLLGSAVFMAVFLHGILAGSDTTQLRLLYAGTGGLVALLATSRRLAHRPMPAVRLSATPQVGSIR